MRLRRGKPPGGPWYGEFRRRLWYEHEARNLFPGIRSRRIPRWRGKGYALHLEVEVPHYGVRTVEIVFRPRNPEHARVRVDGPSGSPHRYRDNSLCMWDPRDPPSQRWVFDDGLVALIGYVIAHLFREAWWRETGKWLGPEAPHDDGRKRELLNTREAQGRAA
jgi:hypothetical protein